jgi:hypothetical protein
VENKKIDPDTQPIGVPEEIASKEPAPPEFRIEDMMRQIASLDAMNCGGCGGCHGCSH